MEKPFLIRVSAQDVVNARAITEITVNKKQNEVGVFMDTQEGYTTWVAHVAKISVNGGNKRAEDIAKEIMQKANQVSGPFIEAADGQWLNASQIHHIKAEDNTLHFHNHPRSKAPMVSIEYKSVAEAQKKQDEFISPPPANIVTNNPAQVDLSKISPKTSTIGNAPTPK